MKKIFFLIIAIILLMPLSTMPSVADEVLGEDENIEQYFRQEPEVIQTIEGYVEYSDSTSVEDEEKDAINLSDDVLYKQINFSNPKKIGSSNMSVEHKKPNFQPFGQEMAAASKFSTQEYSISPMNTSFSEQIGNFSFGTKYSSSLYGAQVNYSTAIFSKYEGRHLALTATFLKSTGSNYSAHADRFQIAPELKITKRLSLLDVMQTDMMQISKKNELVLRYRPNFNKHADDVELELGAGQSFYNDAFVKSSVRFSTNFKL